MTDRRGIAERRGTFGIRVRFRYHLAAVLFCFALVPVKAFALTPSEVMVLANRNAAESRGLAEFYMKRRGIPKENLLLVWITDQETCPREDYDKKIVPPVRRFLAAHPAIRAIAVLYGLPIRIAPGLYESGGQTTTEAAFDSELALVRHPDYDLKFWQPNPLFLGFTPPKTSISRDEVTMVGRLDGPDAAVVRRMIRDSLKAERDGLSGKAYFDARWPAPPKGKTLSGYAFYDASLHRAAARLKAARLPVVLDQSQALFRPGSAPHASLYCGWYSLSRYVPAFTWEPGAVGYHMASGECTTLKEESRAWCRQMLDNGAAATLGPVAEPYIQAFPVPELFFTLLAGGKLTLAEVYTYSLPYLSWQMMLVGDPLYRVRLTPARRP